MIPKIIHNIWIQGYDQLPQENKVKHAQIKKINPDWEFIVWDDQMIVQLLKKYPKIYSIYKKAQQYSGMINTNATKSDVARCVIMKEYGGLYYDFDFECVSSFDQLFQNSKDRSSRNTVYMASSKINFLNLFYPFSKPKYCSCFMAFSKNHPIWEKVMEKFMKATSKYQIGSALDYTLQEYENKYTIVMLNRVNGHYQCMNNERICYTPAFSSWNITRPIFKWMNCYYKQIFLFLLVILIIYVVDIINRYNASLYGIVSFIPGLPSTVTNSQDAPKKKKNK